MQTTTETTATLQATEQTTTTEQATATTTAAKTTSRRRVKLELDHAETTPTGINARYGNVNISVVKELEQKIKRANGTTFCDDGKGVRRLGGSAPSAFLSTRGAADAVNAALLANVKGATVADLTTACATAGAKVPADKLIAHLKGFVQQADPSGMRLRTTGVLDVLKANGWDWRKLPAVTIDGKEWDGTLFKRVTTPASVIQSPMLWAVKFKRTPSLAKALGIED
jgi:hypothetical protein